MRAANPGQARRGRSGGTRLDPKTQPSSRRCSIAVRKAGEQSLLGWWIAIMSGCTRKANGRFNARGRGAKVMASLPRDGSEWQSDSAGRFRSRRVVVTARVVKLNPQRAPRGLRMRRLASKAVDAHLRYLERDGVDPRWREGQGLFRSRGRG